MAAVSVSARIPVKWKNGTIHMAEIIDTRLAEDGTKEYYAHYIDHNRRLDEWISADSFVQTDHVPEEGGDNVGERKLTRNMKRKYDDINHTHKADNNDEIANQMEREHEEATKVKNIQCVELGEYEIDTWYYSPYPEEFSKCSKLFVCEFCLKYMKKSKTLDRHKLKCDLRHPPGDEIYRHENISVFEVDGKKSKTYCQNLCLLAKLFLDHKTLYYDVDPFMFYVMTEVDSKGCHLVGYFSKEKESPEEHNLACILTLPPSQRKGYGRFLISFAYELSKKENKIGTPERPLSDLGLLSFRSYWKSVLLEVLSRNRGNLSIKDISLMTAIRTDDIVSTLQTMGLIKYWKGQHLISVSPKIIEEQRQKQPTQEMRFEPSALHWTPLSLSTNKKPR